MANSSGERRSLFQQLKDGMDPKEQDKQQEAAQARDRVQYEQAQSRLAELVDSNSTRPVTISSIRVLNATHTRQGFLQKIFQPLLSSNQDRPYTLAEALSEVSLAQNKLHRLDIFHEPISTFIDFPNKTDPSTTPTDIDVHVSVKEKSRLLLKTGTEVGNGEGAAYGQVAARNIFGGAESLNLHASLGTRTRSAYQGTFELPFLSNPDYRLELGALSSSTNKSWASHEEVLKEGWARLKWLTSGGHKHELTYSGAWRQVTGLAEDASRTVRNDAGDSVKSSISHSWVSDSRDYPLLPSSGLYVKTLSELAGIGPLKGDVASLKLEAETQSAIPVPLPGIKNSGISFTTGLRAGLLYPLAPIQGASPSPSRINDRFTLGGPADVRGFRISGLGPRDGGDAVGGDIYAAGSANLLLPLPRVGPMKPFRLQAFVNGGRLLSLDAPRKEGKLDSKSIQSSVSSAVKELGNGLPSMAAGIGLVYAHPIARFELNFSLPWYVRQDEECRKGLQFGVGINLL